MPVSSSAAGPDSRQRRLTSWVRGSLVSSSCTQPGPRASRYGAPMGRLSQNPRFWTAHRRFGRDRGGGPEDGLLCASSPARLLLRDGAGGGRCGLTSAQVSEECAQVCGEQLRFLHGGEVAAAGHLREAAQVGVGASTIPGAPRNRTGPPRRAPGSARPGPAAVAPPRPAPTRAGVPARSRGGPPCPAPSRGRPETTTRSSASAQYRVTVVSSSSC